MTYEDIDFNEMYIKQKEQTTFKAKNKTSWNKKAQSMNKSVHKSIYNEEFLKLLDLKDINSALDVGCGVGNISLLLAKKLEKITSLDFSPTMLEILNKNAKDKNLNNIQTLNASWYDSWENVPKADLVIASRCLEVKNMQEALEKLNNQATKQVVISYKVGGTFISDEVLKVMKRKINKKPDYIYLLNILYKMGINASLNFIKSEGRNNNYTSFEDFIKSIIWSLGEINEEEKKALELYYNKNNKTNNSDYVNWAVISWIKH